MDWTSDNLSDAESEVVDEYRPPTQLQQQFDMMAAVRAGEPYKISTSNYTQMGGAREEDMYIDRDLFERNMGLCGFKRDEEWSKVRITAELGMQYWIDLDYLEGDACVWSEIGGIRSVYSLFLQSSDGEDIMFVSPIPIKGIILPKFGPRRATRRELRRLHQEPPYTTQCHQCGLMCLGF
jgi:hypothetical protein